LRWLLLLSALEVTRRILESSLPITCVCTAPAAAAAAAAHLSPCPTRFCP